MVPHPFLRSVCAACLAVAVLAAPARGAVLVLDEDDGVIADAILDGVPFGPPNDGTPDAAGNALAVALRAGVTEMRVVIEIPLAVLAGLAGADIESATLTFNIDDVIGTFGPGFNFDGTAAAAIFAWAWPGNGVVDLVDYNNVLGAPTDTVITGPDNSITDATLAVSGPLAFDIDVTAALQARLDAAEGHLGVTLAVDDDQTATSLDDLGASAAGPPGVGGARLPYLTVVTVESAPPVLSADELKCQAKLAAFAGKYAGLIEKNLRKCVGRVLKDSAAGKSTVAAAGKCIAALDPDPASGSGAAKARVKAEDGIAKACSGLVPAALDSPCDPGAASFADTAACVLDAAGDAAQATVRASTAGACAVLAAVDLEADYVTACTIP